MFHSGLTFFGQPPSNRAANHNELYNMPVPLRRFYAEKLIEAKNKEAEQIKKPTQKNTSQIQQPNIQKS